jgi:DnaK suppressor protein
MMREIAHITEHQRAELRAHLVARARTLADEIGASLRSGQLAKTAFDPASIEESEVGVASVVRDDSELREIEEALARIECGEYGLCVDCGSGIPYVRLAALPEAARCMRCETERERLQAVPARL